MKPEATQTLTDSRCITKLLHLTLTQINTNYDVRMQGHSGCRFVGGPRQCTSPVVATTDISDFGIVRCCSFFRASDWPYQTAVVVKHLPLDSCVMPVTALRASRTTAERADRDRFARRRSSNATGTALRCSADPCSFRSLPCMWNRPAGSTWNAAAGACGHVLYVCTTVAVAVGFRSSPSEEAVSVAVRVPTLAAEANEAAAPFGETRASRNIIC